MCNYQQKFSSSLAWKFFKRKRIKLIMFLPLTISQVSSSHQCLIDVSHDLASSPKKQSFGAQKSIGFQKRNPLNHSEKVQSMVALSLVLEQIISVAGVCATTKGNGKSCHDFLKKAGLFNSWKSVTR